MSIFASARVPNGRYLAELDTVPGFPVIPRQRPALAVEALCPSWCAQSHDPADAAMGDVHERIVGQLTAADPAHCDDSAATALVIVETTDDGRSIEAPRAVLTVAAGAESGYPSEMETQGIGLTADQAEQLGRQLLDAARILRGA